MHIYIHTYIHTYIQYENLKTEKKSPVSSFFFLQRMATILSWTLEINHFFVSMFGNTLAFSKLPLRDILSTQKDIMNESMSKSMVAFKKTWGIEWVAKIFDAYSHLQVNSDVSFAA